MASLWSSITSIPFPVWISSSSALANFVCGVYYSWEWACSCTSWKISEVFCSCLQFIRSIWIPLLSFELLTKYNTSFVSKSNEPISWSAICVSSDSIEEHWTQDRSQWKIHLVHLLVLIRNLTGQLCTHIWDLFPNWFMMNDVVTWDRITEMTLMNAKYLRFGLLLSPFLEIKKTC